MGPETFCKGSLQKEMHGIVNRPSIKNAVEVIRRLAEMSGDRHKYAIDI